MSVYFLCNVCSTTSQFFDEIVVHLQTHPNNSSGNMDDLVSVLQINEETASLDVNTAKPAKVPNVEKVWTSENTLLLIRLVEQFDEEFQTKIKKHVWKKIAQNMNKTTNSSSYDWNKCNTKWKGLIRTYKDIKQHNETSGKNRRQWEYFNTINNFYGKKPEINPVATCSNLTGLITSTQTTNKNSDDSEPSTPSPSNNFETSFSRKRKLLLNPIERRHKDKMANQERFLDIMEKMLEEMKNKNKSKEETEETKKKDN